MKTCKTYLKDFKENNLGINVALKLVKNGVRFKELSINENKRFDKSRIGSDLKVNLKNILRLFKEIFS